MEKNFHRKVNFVSIMAVFLVRTVKEIGLKNLERS